MRRALFWLVVSVVAYLAGCDLPTCGAGWERRQEPDGQTVCQRADAPAATIICDTDGGARIVGGTCVSAADCPAGMVWDANQASCVVGSAGDVPACPPPAGGRTCVNGALHDFLDGTHADVTVHVAIYDPLAFLGGAPPLAEKDVTGGVYVFPDLPAPSLQLLAVAVGDKDGTEYVLTGTAANGIVGGQSYRIDGYVTPRALVDGWKAQTGVDYFATGAYVGRFFADAAPPANDWSIYESAPVANVTLLRDGAPATDAKYFDGDIAHIDPTRTTTGAAGAAIVVPAGGSFSNYSGSGGDGSTGMWQSFAGSAVAKVLFVGRFHRQ